MHTPDKSMNETRVLIAGLIRNGERTISKDMAHLMRTTSGFKQVQALVIESDSSDGTVAELQRMAAQDARFRYLSMGQLERQIPQRAARLAHCRNAYVNEVRTNPLYADIDLILVADLDGMNDLLDTEGLQSCFQLNREWGVLCANQDGAYYDIWALRHPDWCNEDCLRQLSRLEPIFGHETARDIAVYSRQIRIPRDAKPIAVQSAFGGLAIYTRTALLCGGYVGLDESGQEICEHVPHHQRIRDAGHEIYINPALINTGLTIHTRHTRTSKIIRNALKAHFKRSKRRQTNHRNKAHR